MKKDYLFLILNKERLVGKYFEDYERELIDSDRERLDQEVSIDLINKAIEDQKNNLKTLCLPFTNIPTLIFSKLERCTTRGLKNNIKMYKLYLQHMDEAKTLKDVHMNILKDLKAKDLYNKMYNEQVKTLTVLKDIVKKLERKGMR